MTIFSTDVGDEVRIPYAHEHVAELLANARAEIHECTGDPADCPHQRNEDARCAFLTESARFGRERILHLCQLRFINASKH